MLLKVYRWQEIVNYIKSVQYDIAFKKPIWFSITDTDMDK